MVVVNVKVFGTPTPFISADPIFKEFDKLGFLKAVFSPQGYVTTAQVVLTQIRTVLLRTPVHGARSFLQKGSQFLPPIALVIVSRAKTGVELDLIAPLEGTPKHHRVPVVISMRTVLPLPVRLFRHIPHVLVMT